MAVFARVDAVGFEGGVDGGGIAQFEDGLDRAVVGARANEGFVGAFAEDELEGADDDGFAGAGFSGDDGEARCELPFELFDQGEVADAEGGEGGARHRAGEFGWNARGLATPKRGDGVGLFGRGIGWGRGLDWQAG